MSQAERIGGEQDKSITMSTIVQRVTAHVGPPRKSVKWVSKSLGCSAYLGHLLTRCVLCKTELVFVVFLVVESGLGLEKDL